MEYGQRLLVYLPANEKKGLLRRMGVVMVDSLMQEEEGILILEQAAMDPDPDAGALAKLEDLYSQRSDWDRLIELLLRQAATTQDSEEAVNKLARAAQLRVDQSHNKEAAVAIYKELLTRKANHVDALRFLGDWYFNIKDMESAARYLGEMETAAMALDIDDFDAQIETSLYFFRFAEALKATGKQSQAVSRYERALDLNPTHLPSLEAVGPIYMEATDWNKAEKVWRQLLQLTGGHGNSPEVARIYTNLGIVETRLGQLDKARKRFTKALELKPHDIAALQGYAVVLNAAGDWNRLLDTYNQIIYYTNEVTEAMDAYIDKGFVLDGRLHLTENAAQHYEKALLFDNTNPGALLRLAEIALRRQDWNEALRLTNRVSTPPRAPLASGLALVRAVAEAAAGDTVKAHSAFQEALQADPTFAALLGPVSIEDYSRVHEVLRARLQASRI